MLMLSFVFIISLSNKVKFEVKVGMVMTDKAENGSNGFDR